MRKGLLKIKKMHRLKIVAAVDSLIAPILTKLNGNLEKNFKVRGCCIQLFFFGFIFLIFYYHRSTDLNEPEMAETLK